LIPQNSRISYPFRKKLRVKKTQLLPVEKAVEKLGKTCGKQDKKMWKVRRGTVLPKPPKI